MSALVLAADEVTGLPSKYDVQRVLGRGGMGTVFEARHVRLGQRVAIKMLGEGLIVHPDLATRFEREAHAAGSLCSPHAVKVFDVDKTEAGIPFMVMELLEGSDLAHVLEQEGPQPVGAAVRWIIEACDAIGEAHRLGIVHRDLKPSNLFFCKSTSSIKVLDFGIAKRVTAKEAPITQGVSPLGTPQYMSPEQVRCAEDIDGRTDIWSLGVTLYELLCGRPPYDHDLSHACLVAIVTDPIPDPRELRPDLPATLVEAILRALEKDASKRFATVDELVLALEPFADPAPRCDRPGHQSATRCIVARDLTTIDGEPVTGGGSPCPSGRGCGEESVPPAAHQVGARESRDRWVRSTVALAAAAAVALGGAAFSSRGGRDGLEPRSISRARAPAWGAAPILTTASEPAKGRSGAASHEVEDLEPDPSESIGRASSTIAAALPARPRVVPTGTPPHDVVGRSAMLVHGGLSGPGF